MVSNSISSIGEILHLFTCGKTYYSFYQLSDYVLCLFFQIGLWVPDIYSCKNATCNVQTTMLNFILLAEQKIKETCKTIWMQNFDLKNTSNTYRKRIRIIKSMYLPPHIVSIIINTLPIVFLIYSISNTHTHCNHYSHFSEFPSRPVCLLLLFCFAY